MDPGAPAELSVAELTRAFAAGTLSPVDAAEAALDRIARFDGVVNAFVHLDPATTRAMASASATRWRAGAPLSPLDGIPVSIKDLIPVAGWPLRRGSLALMDDPPSAADAPAVARLREAGAVFIGKTATPESGSRIVCRSAVHGVTRNPYAPDRTPGGSSGGAAAALALGMGTLAVGTDGAGSIRIPAAFCNLAGLKPGFGRVPAHPPSFFMPHSVTGPMARRVADVAAMTAIMARGDARDPFAWPIQFDLATAKPLRGLRVALSATLGVGIRPDADTEAATAAAAASLAHAGAEVTEIDPEWPVPPLDPFMVFWEATYAGFLDAIPYDRAERMAPLLHAIAERGRRVDILAYHRALAQRLVLTDTAHAFLTRFDVLVAPVMPGPAFDIDIEAPPGEAPDDWRWCPYTYVFNLTGQPCLSVPAGFTAGGLPLGVQLAGRAGSEATLLATGAVIETASGCVARRPAMLTPR